ncbi:hypothetical protein CAI16_10680 [Virgibacillus dokdonensis]|uniref:Uncharacterized protein n=1 Tax=Virgibacillus dokdonensis TaxID=302167 RepID=A0A3E0WR90_9BACI|nr:hypothetical protein [Virgibacillus dokdonensis]RFA34713.1 hypothetical protein CAI16_10680 [Virgibacillus dokdonensis]
MGAKGSLEGILIAPNAGLIWGLYVVAIGTTVVGVSHAVVLTFYIETAGAGPGINSNTGSALEADKVVDKIITTLN